MSAHWDQNLKVTSVEHCCGNPCVCCEPGHQGLSPGLLFRLPTGTSACAVGLGLVDGSACLLGGVVNGEQAVLVTRVSISSGDSAIGGLWPRVGGTHKPIGFP
jgi:hypothetical protein